ncbi:MAG: TIGR03364 family FAD-dependent oxidoreductase [Saprospiraceae bacterium]
MKTQKQTFDVVVIGSGILGMAHAYHCAILGLKVAVIEKNQYPMDASARNFGQVVPSGFGHEWQKYGRKSLEIYKNIQEEADITVRQTGSLYVAHDEEEMTLLEELAVINQTNNYESHLLTKQETCEHAPSLNSDYVRGALFFPQEINVEPAKLMLRLIHYCMEKLDLTYISNTLVKNVLRANGEVVITTADLRFFAAAKVFLCNGSDLKMLFPDLFATSDLELVKLQMMELVSQSDAYLPGSILTGQTIRRYEGFGECPSYAEIKSKEDFNSQFKKYGVHILFKQTSSGSIIVGDSHEYFDINDYKKEVYTVREKINQFIIAEAQKIITIKNWKLKRAWLGYYTQCKEEAIFSKTIDEHIHIITGIGGKGMTAAFGYAAENVSKLIGSKKQTQTL